MNEIMEQDIQIVVQEGEINFSEYEKLKQEAIEVAEWVRSLDVNEENMKETKKVLAQVNKSVKMLEDKRISVKKQLLEPYIGFEAQVKEIVGIVKEADGVARDKVRELEELERVNKELDIEDIFNARIGAYDYDFVTFKDFIKPQHLNKSVSINKVEEEMVAFLEQVEADLKTIEYMNDNRILNSYKQTLNLNLAIEQVKELDRLEEELNRPEDKPLDGQIDFDEVEAQKGYMAIYIPKADYPAINEILTREGYFFKTEM